jgi:hypothetical protein
MRAFFYRRKFIFIPFAVAAFLSLVSFVVMSLWNYLLPGILHVGAITFWQAMGIFVLCKILFGFGKGGHNRWGRHGRDNPWMRQKMEEKFKSMSPEDREAFKAKMKNHFCGRRDWHGRHRHPFDTNWDDFGKEAVSPEA